MSSLVAVALHRQFCLPAGAKATSCFLMFCNSSSCILCSKANRPNDLHAAPLQRQQVLQYFGGVHLLCFGPPASRGAMPALLQARTVFANTVEIEMAQQVLLPIAAVLGTPPCALPEPHALPAWRVEASSWLPMAISASLHQRKSGRVPAAARLTSFSLEPCHNPALHSSQAWRLPQPLNGERVHCLLRTSFAASPPSPRLLDSL